MALNATIYTLTVELADIDRGVYESLDLRMAREPSESTDYFLVRLLAYCLEYAEGISFTQGVAAGDEPAVWVHDLTGRLLAWIDVGLPDAAHLHKGRRGAERAAVYTHRAVEQLLSQLSGKKIYRAEEIPIYSLDARFVADVAERIERRASVSITRSDGELFVDVARQSCPQRRHRTPHWGLKPLDQVDFVRLTRLVSTGSTGADLERRSVWSQGAVRQRLDIGCSLRSGQFCIPSLPQEAYNERQNLYPQSQIYDKAAGRLWADCPYHPTLRAGHRHPHQPGL